MNDHPVALTDPPEGYGEWLTDLKQRIYAAQQRAVLAVNTEMVALYWRIGQDIMERQSRQGWGAKVIDRLAHDLRVAFPEMRGMSARNLRYMRDFAKAWPDIEIWQQAAAKLPWGHNMVLIDRVKDPERRLLYAAAAVQHGWSRNALDMHIDMQSVERAGKAITNFDRTLPPSTSDLARQSLKDPYKLDFLGLGENAAERAIEQAIVDHLTDFLIELGVGFAYVGRQVHLEIGDDDFYIDLLFYHLQLRCYVVIEIKGGKFKPEHLGQLGFYMTAVDETLRHESDGPTIGLLLCRSKNEIVAEYALKDSKHALGIAEYELLKALPEPLHTSLPTIEQIERELGETSE
ncbi:PDDEXK nuclease domain-containing protein [Leucobacter sp. HY1908]